MEYSLQLANMRKAQDFTLYPYTGGKEITLQSDKRIIRADLETGEGLICDKNHNFPGFHTIAMGNIKITLPEATRTAILTYLKNNSGIRSTANGMLQWENKELPVSLQQ